MTYGSAGNGSAAHLAMAAFNLAAGTQMTHVPYRGTAPMMTDLLGGQIDMTMTGGPGALPPTRAGLLRALGVSALQRIPSAPDIPTISEQGVTGFEATSWFGLVAPAGTPRAVVDRVNAEAGRALTRDQVRARLLAEGADPSPGTPERFGQMIVTERTRWADVVSRAGMRTD
jgi:tripartite-type tricarboxylate transporter receptor subunit TctC